MTHSIYIAHANTVLSDGWKMIEASSETPIEDIVAYPTFQWEFGTLVKSVGGTHRDQIYTGAFNDIECVDIGPRSDAVRPFEMHLMREEEEWVNQYSLVRRWQLCNIPSWMMLWIYEALPEPLMMKCLHKISEEMSKITNTYFLKTAITHPKDAEAIVRSVLVEIQRYRPNMHAGTFLCNIMREEVPFYELIEVAVRR